MQRLISLVLLAGLYVPVLAQSSGGAPAQGGSKMFGSTMIMMVLMFLVIYMLMIRPEQKKSKDRQNMIKEIKRGDRVLMAGGMYGTVGNVKDSTVMVKVSENVVLEFTKASISAVLNEDGTEKKPVSAKADSKQDKKDAKPESDKGEKPAKA
jgi:preprotein translocase subunit YajC